MNKLFPVIEVGSLAKLPGRQTKLGGGSPTATDINNIERVLEAASSDGELRQFLSSNSRDDVMRLNSVFNLRLLEFLGLDYVFDGEAHRTEMYEHVLRSVQGMERLGRVAWNKQCSYFFT